MSHDAELARGRDAGQRSEWADAYRSLSLSDESAALTAEDLELLAAAAYLLGHIDECRLALRRAHQVHVAGARAGDAELRMAYFASSVNTAPTRLSRGWRPRR